MGDVDADPLALEFLGSMDACSAPTKRVEHDITLVRTCGDNSLQEGKWFLCRIFEHLATPTKLQALGLEEVLNWTETALNRVDRGLFFANFEEKHAVQYFYEPFLAAYDPVLRKRMGVWLLGLSFQKYSFAAICTIRCSRVPLYSPK
jgi:hypothetical protein